MMLEITRAVRGLELPGTAHLWWQHGGSGGVRIVQDPQFWDCDTVRWELESINEALALLLTPKMELGSSVCREWWGMWALFLLLSSISVVL